jgi:hypothetical protein
MAEYHTTLYDTWEPGVTANAEARLFQVPEGGDATHNSQYTNMRGAGSLPSEESFEVHAIHVVQDENVPQADLDTYLYGSFIELRIKDRTVFRAPTMMCMSASARSGHFTQATASNVEFIGPMGQGFRLMRPVTIPGGVPFHVRAVQGAAFAAPTSFKVVLEGILTTPD